MSRVVQLRGNQTFISHFHFRYRGHFPLSSSSQRTLAIFPPFIFVDLSAVIWEIRDRSQLDLCSRSQLSISALALSSQSLLSLSARSLPLSVARRDLWKLASSTPLVDRALSPLQSLSRRSLSRYCQLLVRRLSRFRGALPISSSFSALATALPLSSISLALLLIANPFHGKEK
ncbi:hypothetical protein MRB53_021568 [Persea americana]|uniref:Uncharacterized protein n=1 Tax=Persea americana TaxID=3435 RepID=A0ACC2L4C8_PERAE|nr:hypothetical protein MRB53_021568 [Persea americana]